MTNTEYIEKVRRLIDNLILDAIAFRGADGDAIAYHQAELRRTRNELSNVIVEHEIQIAKDKLEAQGGDK